MKYRAFFLTQQSQEVSYDFTESSIEVAATEAYKYAQSQGFELQTIIPVNI